MPEDREGRAFDVVGGEVGSAGEKRVGFSNADEADGTPGACSDRDAGRFPGGPDDGDGVIGDGADAFNTDTGCLGLDDVVRGAYRLDGSGIESATTWSRASVTV